MAKEYYMGSTKTQKKYCKYIEDTFPKLKIIWKRHDDSYILSLKQPNLIMCLIDKFFNDLTLLFTGLWRSFWILNPFIGIGGCVVIILAYVCIVFYTPLYIKEHYKIKRVE